MPKKNAINPISINVAALTDMFNLNTMNVIIKLAAKHRSMVLRKPMALAIQPETMLPIKPEVASIIIVMPRRLAAFAALFVMLSIHVGAHENTAHKPISIAPKMMEPFMIFFLCDDAKSLLLNNFFSADILLFCFQLKDSGKIKMASIAVIKGMTPVRNALRHSGIKLFKAPATMKPTGMAAETIPKAMALLFSDHNSAIKILVVTIMPPTPKPVAKR